MNELDIKRRDLFSVGPHMLGLIFIAVGIFTLVSPLFMGGDNSITKAIIAGSLAIIVGCMIIASYGGTYFDFTEKRYKEYYSISGFRIGKWQTTPVINMIKVFPHTFKATRSADGIHPSTSGEISRYVIALYGNNNLNPILVFENSNKQQTLKDAKTFSEQLKVAMDNKLV
jgi:hypothetical protein